jgi:hypothetical protein
MKCAIELKEKRGIIEKDEVKTQGQGDFTWNYLKP